MKLFEIKHKKTEEDPEAKHTDFAEPEPSTIGGVDLNPPTSSGELTKPTNDRVEPKVGKSIKGKIASSAQSRIKAAAIMPDQETSDKIAAGFGTINTDELDLEDEIDDQTAAERAGLLGQITAGVTEPPTPENLPARISTAIAKTSSGVALVDPQDIEWHMVKHLPGYLAQAIRALGRQVFKPFTKTPIEDIQVIANLGNGGPNSNADIQTIATYLRQSGQRNSAAELHFHKVIPGYKADIVAYNAEGYTFLLVKDMAGEYVYSWPESDSKSFGIEDKTPAMTHLGAPPKRLH